MLEARNLTKIFNRKKAIEDICFSIDPGIYGLLGPNGAGKTTLIRCLTNLYRYKGMIFFKGENIKENTNYVKKLGYLPQKFGAYRDLTVEENLLFFCELKWIEKKQQKNEVERVLGLVNLTEERDKKAKHLSGGMLRRLGIAQALLGNPDVLIFDEPTAGLDPEERLRFKMLISSLSKDKIILVSTHIVEDVEALCNQIIILKGGKMRFKGNVAELKAIANAKTFECDDTYLQNLPQNAFIEKCFENDGKTKYRFVSNEPQTCEAVNARIEDGYICVLEEI